MFQRANRHSSRDLDPFVAIHQSDYNDGAVTGYDSSGQNPEYPPALLDWKLPLRSEQISPLIFLFFFLSGLSALIFEVTWVRELGLTLGNTAQATSTVLAVFMGGLALGAFFAGRFAEKTQRKALAVYGVLELCAGVVGLLVSMALQECSSFYLWLFHSLSLGAETIAAARLIVSVCILAVPTILMGATLPVLVKYLEEYKLSSRMFSLLYGMNTLGASAGGLLACFLGFPFIGLQGTVQCAASLNVLIGMFSILIWRRSAAAGMAGEDPNTGSAVKAGSGSVGGTPVIPGDQTDDDLDRSSGTSKAHVGDNVVSESNSASEKTELTAEPVLPLDAQAPCRRSQAILYAIAFLTGFTALSYEVLWTRILRFYLSSLTYSFSIMVSTFLFGLAIGSFIYERQVLRDSIAVKRPYLFFAATQAFAALSCAASLILFSFNSKLILHLLNMAAPLAPALQKGMLLHQLLYIFLVSSTTILLPSIFVGMLFPLIGTLSASEQKNAAKNVGTAYALNTIGCVCGSLLCGLLLMPAIGSKAAFQWIVLLSTITAALAALSSESKSHAIKWSIAAIPVLLASLFLTQHFRSGTMPGARILAEGEDGSGYMRVIELPQQTGVMLEINGSSLAGTSPKNLRYMRSLAHLPLLLHKNPKTAMVACFGTGTTCGAASLHSSLDELDIVEISRMVLSAAPYFDKTNYSVLKCPRVKVFVNDARNHLLQNDSKYDVITFEPPPPTEAGIVNLYTEEFYALASNKLNEDGLLCQWIPMHQVSAEVWKMMIASARAVFPNVSIWLPNSKEAILLASKQPLHIDLEQMQKRIDDSEELKASLDAIGMDNAMAILSTYVASGEALDAYLKDSLSLTDNYPRLEFYLPFAGPSPGELKAESIGNTDVKQFAAALSHAKGFNANEFWKNWTAIHLLRLVENTTPANRAEADKYIDQAMTLLPKSKWLQYVNKRRGVVYPNKDFSSFTY